MEKFVNYRIVLAQQRKINNLDHYWIELGKSVLIIELQLHNREKLIILITTRLNLDGKTLSLIELHLSSKE